MKNALVMNLCLLALAIPCAAQTVDERPGASGEWGFHPGPAPARNPPSFSWRPQRNATSYDLQIAPTEAFEHIVYETDDLEFNVHCPSATLEPGTWWWRFRYHVEDDLSDWSTARTFTLSADATLFPFPTRDQILARVPDQHPRLFLRPENVPAVRAELEAEAPDRLAALIQRGEALIADPPDVSEPPTYPEGVVRGSDPWREIWWGNRRRTIAVLDGAATLGFLYTITGDRRFGDEARRLLIAAATWNPRGSTGYRYNDEAGMPYAYHFSRTYTFIHDLLTDEERAECRRIMRIRGREMYEHLCPRHLWRPYSSHSNRAWHFLGEVAIAFHGEIREADDWLWFACNVFANTYPVWSDADGGWHEGVNYWSSYIGRFTWWADVMREAIDVDAYELPYFSQAGSYAMYMVPPGSSGGGFGDLNARVTSARLAPLMTTLAAQSGNPHWRWYVDQVGGPAYGNDYPSLLRSILPAPAAETPIDLPTSRQFAGTGQAVLNATLLDAADNVQVVFKSSPFGTQSHGYESQNAFLLSAFGEPLLIRSGYRDSYGSRHHRDWMWNTISVNSVTVNGRGQLPHSAKAVGSITEFSTSEHVDYVEGDATPAYEGRLTGFRRGVLFLKPDVVIILDHLQAPDPAAFQFLLHTPTPMSVEGDVVQFTSNDAACVLSISSPAGADISTTDQFQPPPRERIQLTHHHLTAETAPTAQTHIVSVIRPYRAGDAPPPLGVVTHHRQGCDIELPIGDRTASIRCLYSDRWTIGVVWRENGEIVDHWKN